MIRFGNGVDGVIDLATQNEAANATLRNKKSHWPRRHVAFEKKAVIS